MHTVRKPPGLNMYGMPYFWQSVSEASAELPAAHMGLETCSRSRTETVGQFCCAPLYHIYSPMRSRPDLLTGTVVGFNTLFIQSSGILKTDNECR